MDRIAKALKKLSAKECKTVEAMLRALYAERLQGLDVKKLRGREDVFRVRKGDIRIIYHVKNGRMFVLAIEQRSEKTYKF